ncbi:MAG: hypothetical protein RMJ87_01885 [Cytophagales bacterium]|nr:hypothetical protein [Bernardetiaceae bacterium]MDW8203753.1 hypothetical protein [Cytophagales bacterium]
MGRTAKRGRYYHYYWQNCRWTTSTWEFSVEDHHKEVIDSIQKAIDEDKRVKLYYEEKFYTYPWRGDTKYLITKVEILD